MSIEKLKTRFEKVTHSYYKKLIRVLFKDLELKEDNVNACVDYFIKESNVLSIYEKQAKLILTEEDIKTINNFNDKGLDDKLQALGVLMETELQKTLENIDEDTVGKILLGEV